MMRIVDRNYNAVDIISNETEEGLNFKDDRLTTTLASGLYTLEFTTDKVVARHNHLEVGNMIETVSPQGKQLLMTITSINENTLQKVVFCEDTIITMLNGFIDALEDTPTPEKLTYYANHALKTTPFEIKVDESEEVKILSFHSSQRRLERMREIAYAFNVELDFSVDFTPGKPPKFFVSFLKKRKEIRESFRISTDDVVEVLEKETNIYNVMTKMLVRGARKEATQEQSSQNNLRQQESVPKRDDFVERMIARAFEIKKMGRTYQWGGNGNPSWDCSGFMQACIEAAGQRVNHRATTYTMQAGRAPFTVIPLSDLQRGDLIMYDTGYTTPGDWNHVGLYLGPSLEAPNSVIHAGNPVGITQKANSMKIVGAVRVTRP